MKGNALPLYTTLKVSETGVPIKTVSGPLNEGSGGMENVPWDLAESTEKIMAREKKSRRRDS